MRTEHAHNGQHFVPSFMLKCNNVPRKGGGVVLFSMQIYMLQQVLSFTIQKFGTYDMGGGVESQSTQRNPATTYCKSGPICML